MKVGSVEFREVVVLDFEFAAPAGERLKPVCAVASELVSGRVHRLFGADLHRATPPYPIGSNSLVVAYYASAEVGCHLALEWAVPRDILDLYVEFRNSTNGLVLPCGSGLVGALAYFGEDTIAAAEKDSMRQIALRGGEYTDVEKRKLLDYCESDVLATRKLLGRLSPRLDLPRALMRGRFMAAAASMEARGVPIDVGALATLRRMWPHIQDELIRRIDALYNVFDGRTFKADRFARWLSVNGIPWPRLDSGHLALDEDTFRQMARSYPSVAPIRELRFSLSQMRLEDLAVGSDGRNRTILSAFRARTGRNQPSSTKNIFGPSTWLRSLIRPNQGTGLVYRDWAQQEFGIAAALSGDPGMIAAYESGDPYLAFAKAAGAVPADGTKKSHGALRELFKTCALGVLYSMGPEALAARIGQPVAYGRDLLRMHRETYPRFWRWSDSAVDHAMLRGQLHTAFGWVVHIGPDVNPRSLRNFPMQGNGAEMLRIGCADAIERGISICTPVHDAVLFEAPSDELEAADAVMQQAMSDASALVLGGFRLRSESKVVLHPDRYMDERGRHMWNEVRDIIQKIAVEQQMRSHIGAEAGK
jgi:DNA polymerase-1